MLGKADPLEAHIFGELALFHPFLIALHRSYGVVVSRGNRPAVGEFVALRISHGAEIGRFHRLTPRYGAGMLAQMRA